MNVIYISLDCCRYDSFSFTGNPHAQTPNIDRIRSNGWSFDKVYCQAPYTPASHASFLTGVNPYAHGIRTMYGTKLFEECRTHAQTFKHNGFETAAFVGYEGLLSECGLSKGFDHFDECSNLDSSFGKSQLGFKGNDWRDDFKRWHDTSDQSKEKFLFFHYFHSHAGSEDVIPTKYNGVGRKGMTGDPSIDKYYDTYDGKISWFDQEWLPVIMDRFPPETTRYIITSDHGDMWDKTLEVGHRRHLFDATTHIPLITTKNPGSLSMDSPLQATEVLHEFGVSGQSMSYSSPRSLLGTGGHPFRDAGEGHYVYFETYHKDIPGWRIGLLDTRTNRRYVWTSPDLEEFRWDICYTEPTEEAQELFDAISDTVCRLPNYYDPSADHKERLESLGYL